MSKIILAEQASAPDTPSSGKVAIFVDTNGNLAWKDDAGNVKKVAAAGAYTLTIPATGTAALRGAANTFTAAQTVNVVGSALVVQDGSGNNVIDFPTISAAFGARISAADLGANAGPYVLIGNNTNGSTNAAGRVTIATRGGTYYHVWPDNSGNLRIGATAPTNANDTSGTVVGAQTSMAAAKHLFDDVTPIGDVLASIQQAAAAAVRRFTYRSGAFNGEQFEGVVTDLAPRYGMDRDEEHPAGKSLNEITLLGDLVRAVAWLSERVAALERRSDCS